MTADLDIGRVYPNPAQPRKLFVRAELENLAASIKSEGLLVPIQVRADDHGRFMIVMGERRWRAHNLNGAATIRAEVVTITDDELADRAIIENLQRRDITPLEEAHAFQARLDTGLSVEDLAKRLGLKQAWRITERTNLLRLTPEFQEALAKKVISPSQAKAMSKLDPPHQTRLFRAIEAGRCQTRNELRRVGEALLAEQNQVELFPGQYEPATDDEKESVRRLEAKISSVAAIIAQGFDDNEVTIASKVNPMNADIMADKLALMELSLKKLRLALRAASVIETEEAA